MSITCGGGGGGRGGCGGTDQEPDTYIKIPRGRVAVDGVTCLYLTDIRMVSLVVSTQGVSWPVAPTPHPPTQADVQFADLYPQYMGIVHIYHQPSALHQSHVTPYCSLNQRLIGGAMAAWYKTCLINLRYIARYNIQSPE